MLKFRTFKILVIIILAYVLLTLPGCFWASYLESPVGIAVVLPFLSIYLFHKSGIPGLLVNDGNCGWSWCAPTLFGWVFLVAFWIILMWIIAWGIATLTDQSSER